MPGEAQQLPPALVQVSQGITPNDVFLAGSSLGPSAAAVSLELFNPSRLVPLDILLVLDSSGGANLQDVRAAGQAVLEHLGQTDRVGVVVYAGQAHLATGLTSDFQRAAEAVSDIMPGSGSDLSGALHKANDELLRQGRAEAARAIVLVSTGFAHNWNTVLAEAQRSLRLKIRIFGFGAGNLTNEHLLSQISDRTGGTLYSLFNQNGLADLFSRLGRQLFPPSDIVIQEVLPSYVLYMGSEANPPTQIYQSNPQAPTVLLWRIPSLPQADHWRTVYNVSVTRPGRVAIFTELPLIRYREYEGAFSYPRQIILPTLRLTVRELDFELLPTQPRIGENILFTGKLAQGASEGANWQWNWDFGDGSSGSGRVVVHKYGAAGSYDVRLTATSPSGQSTTLEKQLTVSAQAS